MPTTPEEAKKIVRIVNKYLEPKRARNLSWELNEYVGKTTDNDSLRVTLQMLSDLYELDPFQLSQDLNVA
jgi:hypothetical protein